MNFKDLVRLLSLAAIWGSSFFFMRIASPVLGSAYLAEGRAFFAAVFLLCLAIFLKKNLRLLNNWRHFLIMGFFNSAFPFVLFGYASLTLQVSQLSILNSTAPLWAFIIGLITKSESFNIKRFFGLILGIVGVTLLLVNSLRPERLGELSAYILALVAALSYGIATNYAKKSNSIEPFDNAHGSMWASAILIIPVLLFIPIQSYPTTAVFLAVIALGVLCSGIAYLLYFKIIKDVGATSALTVSFLIPLFATLWGFVFLDEKIELNTIIGMVVVIIGTLLVTEFSFNKPIKTIK
jgi:drug/metabolite transporter (DMT)-like permease